MKVELAVAKDINISVRRSVFINGVKHQVTEIAGQVGSPYQLLTVERVITDPKLVCTCYHTAIQHQESCTQCMCLVFDPDVPCLLCGVRKHRQ